MDIQVYRHFNDIEPVGTAIGLIVHKVRTCSTFAYAADMIRNHGDELMVMRNGNTIDNRTYFKRKYGFCTFGAIMEGKRCYDNVKGLTGLVLVDIDHIPSSDIERVRSLVNADPCTYLSWVTYSGCGLRILCRFMDREIYGRFDWLQVYYHNAFEVACSRYSTLTGYECDGNVGDCCRISYYTYDPLAYLNEGCDVLNVRPLHEGFEPPRSSAPKVSVHEVHEVPVRSSYHRGPRKYSKEIARQLQEEDERRQQESEMKKFARKSKQDVAIDAIVELSFRDSMEAGMKEVEGLSLAECREKMNEAINKFLFG